MELTDKLSCIGVIYMAHNCPVHNDHDYSFLEWFDTWQKLINYVMNHSLSNCYITELWDAESRKLIKNIEVKYYYSLHSFNYAEFKLDGEVVCIVKRDPYDAGKCKIEIIENF